MNFPESDTEEDHKKNQYILVGKLLLILRLSSVGWVHKETHMSVLAEGSLTGL